MPIQTFLPVVGALSSVVLIVVLRNSNPIFLVIGGLLLVVALVGGLGVALTQRGNAARTRRTQRELVPGLPREVPGSACADPGPRGARQRASCLDPDPRRCSS